MSPDTRSSAKAAAEAGPSASQGQSIAPSSAPADTNARPVTSADLLQFLQQMREEDNRRREEDNRRRDEDNRRNRSFQEQSLSFQKLLLDRFGPSPATTSSQPSPSPSLGKLVEVETAKPSASADVIDVQDVHDVHAAPTSIIREITPSRGTTRGTRGGASRTPQDLKTLASQWDSMPYILYTSPMPTQHLVRQVFPSLVDSEHVGDYHSFDCNKLMATK
ncbi:MAG: hypothetical protein SEPTF4163_006702, partial [Sporothrix epigloea]